MGRRRLFRLIYSMVACLAIIIYGTIAQQDAIRDVNNAIETAKINTGEITKETNTENPVSDIDQPTLEILSKGIYKDRYQEGKKLVLYSGKNQTISGYEQSSDWTKKFVFVKVNTSELEGAYSKVKKPCKGICIIDFEKKKLYSIPQNKTNDSEYIYEVLSKHYN